LSPRRRHNTWRLLLPLVVIALWSEAASAAAGLPRYSLRRVYGQKPGPRAVIITIPYVTWQDLRRANAPNLHFLMERGAIGLMPVASASDDPTRTWATLGAGRSAVGREGVSIYLTGGNMLVQRMLELRSANEMAMTHAQPGALGDGLREYGLKAAVLGGTPHGSSPAFVVADEAGRMAAGDTLNGLLVRWSDEGGRADLCSLVYQEQVAPFLARYDVVALDLSTIMTAFDGRLAREEGVSPVRRHRLAAELLARADPLVGMVLRELGHTDSLIAVVCPEQPYYEHPDKQKSMGPVVLYETKHPRQGLLYTDLTRWPGLVTAADFAPTLLDWWGIPTNTPNETMDGRVLQVRPGGPADIDRLDRTLTDHFRWSFIAIPVHMGFGALLMVLGVVAAFWRPQWWPRLHLPALAFPLLPVGYLLAHGTGAPNVWVLITLGLAFVFAIAAIARAASRAQPAPISLAIAMLAGAAVIGADTLTGNHRTIISAYSPPPLIGGRYYGLGNEHMGFLVGMVLIGLAALWEWRPWRGGVVAAVSVATVLVISAPFWGANWGGGFTAAFTLLLFWLLAAPQRWWRAIPLAVLLLAVAALLPGAMDLLFAPSPQTRTHLGAAMATLLSHHGDVLADIARRKLATSLWVFFYTLWTPVLGVAALVAFSLLLRSGGAVRRALRDQPKIAAGIAAALLGGVVSSVVNDSGVVAGAGLWCAALAASLYVAARPQERPA